MNKIILYMEDLPEALEAHSSVLEEAGYLVVKAPTLEDAERVLQRERVHLGLFDIRMLDNDNPKDLSGLHLAQKEEYAALPKIILTGHPHYSYVREALGVGSGGLPPAINFIDKNEGPEALINAVEQAFKHYVHINWDLVIQWNENQPLSFLHLVKLIDAKLEDNHLVATRADELEDLFRRLFYKRGQIKIDRLLWQRGGRVALTVHTFAEGKSHESYVVVCGHNAQVNEEAHRYKEYAPKAPGVTATMLCDTGETLHYAANSYALAAAPLESIQPLAYWYQAGSDKSFNAVLKSFYEDTLADWHQKRPSLEEHKTLDDLYREHLGLTAKDLPPDVFADHLQSLVHRLPVLGTKLEYTSEKLLIHLHDQRFSYASPAAALSHQFNIGHPTLLMKSPGTLSGDNILVGATGQAWLTDFADAGLAPLFWNFVALEAAIRFDWTDTSKLQRIHEMEQYLVGQEFSKLHYADLEGPTRKALKAIQTIRLLATQLAGKDTRAYHLGLLFHALNRLARFRPAHQYKEEKLARLAHALIAAAMIYDKLAQTGYVTAVKEEPRETGIRIDKGNYKVWVDGVSVTLSTHSYALLSSLYDSPNRMCTRGELYKQVFGEAYDDLDRNQASRLNTAISRLREKIEEDPDKPRYVLREPNVGYRLVVDPE